MQAFLHSIPLHIHSQKAVQCRLQRSSARSWGRIATRCCEASPSSSTSASSSTSSSSSSSSSSSEFRTDVPLLNTVILTGRLGADPQLRRVGRNSIELCTFSLAVQDEYVEGEERGTSWFNVQLWSGKASRAAALLRKGLRVGITGRLSIDSWTGKDGEERESIVINASGFEILQSRSEIGYDASTLSMSGSGDAQSLGAFSATSSASPKTSISDALGGDSYSGNGVQRQDMSADEEDPF